MGLRQYTYEFEDYPKIANDLFEKYGIDQSVPVDPEIIAMEMNIPIVPAPGLKRDYGIKGVCCLVDGNFEIYIDKYHYYYEVESSLFTIGEEIGHIILHIDGHQKITFDSWKKEASKITEQKNKYLHQEARSISSHIIFPANTFTDYAINMVDKNYKDYNSRWNRDKADLAENIAEDIASDVDISQHICKFSLLRWPDKPIDKIIERWPDLCKNKKNRF